jgi:nucleotide-binding universal stress UspA family protein
LFEKILVPIDGSEYSNKALEYALELAEKHKSTIEIFTVVSLTHIPIVKTGATAIKIIAPSYYQSMLNDLRLHHEEMLSETLKKAKAAKPNMNISSRLVEGRPGDRIIGAAKEGDFNLIVMGSRGLGGIKEFFLGSVADRVADEASCPVLIVR